MRGLTIFCKWHPTESLCDERAIFANEWPRRGVARAGHFSCCLLLLHPCANPLAEHPAEADAFPARFGSDDVAFSCLPPLLLLSVLRYSSRDFVSRFHEVAPPVREAGMRFCGPLFIQRTRRGNANRSRKAVWLLMWDFALHKI